MANATAKRLTRNPIIGVTLELSVEEALVLSSVLAQVAGPAASAVQYVHSVFEALEAAGIYFYPELSSTVKGLYGEGPVSIGFAPGSQDIVAEAAAEIE